MPTYYFPYFLIDPFCCTLFLLFKCQIFLGFLLVLSLATCFSSNWLAVKNWNTPAERNSWFLRSVNNTERSTNLGHLKLKTNLLVYQKVPKSGKNVEKILQVNLSRELRIPSGCLLGYIYTLCPRQIGRAVSFSLTAWL